MPHSQVGIFALGEASQAHFELDVLSDEHAKRLVEALVELERPHSTVSGVNVVVGFRPSLWARIAPAEHQVHAHDFNREIAGADGYTMPATQHDAWLWFTGPSYDVIFDEARDAIKTLRSLASVAREISGWAYRHSRDLTGFEDGTANPSLLEAPDVTCIPEGEPGAGSCIVLLQQWRHNMEAFDKLDEAAQERVIGRTKAESRELEAADMPADSHVARTELHDEAGAELPIFRRSVPYGNLGDHGLMFVGFAREQRRLDRMLLNMAGVDGPRDALTYFSTPLSGSYYVVPSTEALLALSANERPV